MSIAVAERLRPPRRSRRKDSRPWKGQTEPETVTPSGHAFFLRASVGVAQRSPTDINLDPALMSTETQTDPLPENGKVV